MKQPRFHFHFLILLLSGLLAAPAYAQQSPIYYDYPRSGLDWYTIETEHFNILFHADEEGQGSSRTAQVVARIAEDIYTPITSLYQLEPETKVAIILKDFEDYSNGAAYFFDNKIEIWAPALDTPLRGEHNWLRNVITHEFTHIVQVQATMKASRKLPFLYFQLLDYESVRRPDVLYGYPNKIITYPIPVLNNPAWLAEGTAQYQRAWLDYDRWDTHRDMLLRTRVLADEELSLADMGGFYSKTSLMREGVYNHGFAFSQYLANTYGEDGLRRLSEALGKWRNWNVERALEDAFSVPAADIYADWMETLRREYQNRTAPIEQHLVDGDLVEPDGFSNFYPQFSPDGSKVAYVSNRGEDFNLMSLYVRDMDSEDLAVFDLGTSTGGLTHTCAFGHVLTAGGPTKAKGQVDRAFDWRPDGKALVYAKRKETSDGSLFADLYELDLETKDAIRLTTEQRATSPAYAPDGGPLAFISQHDGTTNLNLLDRETKAVTALTAYADGTQVTDPVWHPSGDWIYFALLDPEVHGRDLWRIRADGTGAEAVLATAADERSPAFDAEGRLYYSSDASGIFNIYRLADGTGKSEQLTNVLGGAFMPDIRSDGAMTYASYRWDGYKVAMLAQPAALGTDALAQYIPPPITQKQETPPLASADFVALNRFNDTDLQPLAGEAISAVRTEGNFPLRTVRGTNGTNGAIQEPLEVQEYGGSQFTSFSFFPVLRFDQYVTRQRGRFGTELGERTRAETLLRNTKVGTYMSSREILEGLSLLGGIMISPASQDAETALDFFSPSRLLTLERDAFLIFDYKRGLGLIPQRWSPQFSVELYNIRRRVDSGLSIEEFPCTACLPDTTLADLSYGLWEADIFARGKVNKLLLLEAGYRYSPYSVTTESFFSKEENLTIPSSSSRYFIGRAYMLGAYVEAFHPYRDSDVVPRGLRAEVHYEFEKGRLLETFEIEDGRLVPAYSRANNHRLLLDARYGFRMPGTVLKGTHGVGLRLRGSTIFGDGVDDFYNDYVGGLTGARGYPFYALGGNETLWFQAAYHFPLIPNLRQQLLFAYFDKVYARVYADAAMAWSGDWPGLDHARKDIGAEVRLGLGSFYLLPTAVFVSATYGLDRFDFQLDDDFVTATGGNTVSYGQEWQWHFGVLFGFDL